MTQKTSGQRAIHLLRAGGFGAIDSGPTVDGGSHAEMADIVGRRVRVVLDADGNLIKATPMGEWVRDIEHRFPYWPDRPYVTTVEALEILLNKVGVN